MVGSVSSSSLLRFQDASREDDVRTNTFERMMSAQVDRADARLRRLMNEISSVLKQMTAELERTGASMDQYEAVKKQLLAAEYELKAVDQQLDNELVERTLLERSLGASNKELQDFVYMTSHDLREPLRKISSFGAVLEESLHGKIGREDRENLGFIMDGAERMTRMIENLLAYSRINTKTLVIETVSLNDILAQLAKLELRELLESVGGRIEIPQPLPNVQADPTLIRQLLRNLISNRIKNHKEGVEPRITISSERSAGDVVKIQLEDHGTSAETENHKDFFKLSLKSHSWQDDEEPGTSLAVCKKIVDRHGGRVGITSKAGVGLTLWFTLPVPKDSEQKRTVALP
jgi:light-regulated signal transduction histidine kinase (bacteriophytochrome)